MLNNLVALLDSGVPASTNSYESIETFTVGSGGQATITFSSIPSTYKHLQLRVMAKNSSSGSFDAGGRIRFNSDSGNNYANHELYGVGSGTPSSDVPGGSNPYSNINWILGSSQMSANIFDILDYSNTNKNKTVRQLGGTDTNGGGIIQFQSGMWMNTSAISSIVIDISSGSFAQYSSFALYGIKG